MNITVTLEGKTPADIAKQFVALGQKLNELGAADHGVETTTRRGKGNGKAAENLDDESQGTFDLDDEGGETDTDVELEGRVPEVTKKEVLKALKEYVAGHDDGAVAGRKAALKVLAKYKAKGIDDLSPKHYAAVITQLG